MRRTYPTTERANWTVGAVAGSLLAGVAISGLMLAKERISGEPSDLIQWERAGMRRLSVPFAKRHGPGLPEQATVHGAHLGLSALGGLAYAAAFDEDAPMVSSGLAFGAGFYVACHWFAGPLLR